MRRYGMDYGRDLGYRRGPDFPSRAPFDRGYRGYDRDTQGDFAPGRDPWTNQRQHARGWIHAYDREMQRGRGRGRTHFTGMESNRYRGVYDSGLRAGEDWSGEHGGYRGLGRNRGGGMNPGRYGGW